MTGRTKLCLIMTAILPLLTLFLISCDLTSPQDSAKIEIKDTLYNLGSWFNLKDISSIMTKVDTDYRHNGNLRWNFRELWLDRMAEYSLLSIDGIVISVNGDYATVYMTMNFDAATSSLELIEPEDSGDVSYFHFNGSNWMIYGNQEFVKKGITHE